MVLLHIEKWKGKEGILVIMFLENNYTYLLATYFTEILFQLFFELFVSEHNRN